MQAGKDVAGRIEARLKELGIELPQAMEPKVAKILTAKAADRLLFVSGQMER